MKLTKSMLKSNKGFTVQDVAIAIMVIVAFASIVSSTYLVIYKTQASTKIDAIATLYTVQITERIDKLSYDDVAQENLQTIIATMKSDFTIPSSFEINLDIIPYNDQDIIKTVKLTLNYTALGSQRAITIERLKVKEV